MSSNSQIIKISSRLIAHCNTKNRLLKKIIKDLDVNSRELPVIHSQYSKITSVKYIGHSFKKVCFSPLKFLPNGEEIVTSEIEIYRFMSDRMLYRTAAVDEVVRGQIITFTTVNPYYSRDDLAAIEFKDVIPLNKDVIPSTKVTVISFSGENAALLAANEASEPVFTYNGIVQPIKIINFPNQNLSDITPYISSNYLRITRIQEYSRNNLPFKNIGFFPIEFLPNGKEVLAQGIEIFRVIIPKPYKRIVNGIETLKEDVLFWRATLNGIVEGKIYFFDTTSPFVANGYSSTRIITVAFPSENPAQVAANQAGVPVITKEGIIVQPTYDLHI